MDPNLISKVPTAVNANSIADGIDQAFSSPDVSAAFNGGLLLAGGIVATCLVFSMLRTIGGDNHEDL